MRSRTSFLRFATPLFWICCYGAAPTDDIVKGVVHGVQEESMDIAQAVSVLADVLAEAQATATPTSPAEVQSIISSILAAQPTANVVTNAVELIQNGLDAADPVHNIVGQFDSRINSYNNSNPDPPVNVYPKSSLDAPYSVPEEQLRAAIYIPEDFSYGANGKQPVILAPGTCTYGGAVYAPNYAKLLAATDFADQLWLNIPRGVE